MGSVSSGHNMWVFVIRLLIAIFGASPIIEKLVKISLNVAKRAKIAKAQIRKYEKDKLVDETIDDTNKRDDS